MATGIILAALRLASPGHADLGTALAAATPLAWIALTGSCGPSP